MTTLGDPSGQNRAQRRAAARRPRATAIAGGASVLAAGLSVVGAGTAGAVPPSFVVTSLEDEGDGTLRDVIATAASEPGHDVITFDVTGTIVVEDQLEIIDTDDVTIQGPGVGVLTLDGEDSSRIFYLGGEGDITISGMTLHDGFSIGTYATGGAIQATEQGGAVTLANLAITSSLADGSGAGVMANGDITITGSVFAGNESPNGTGAHVLIAGGVGVIEDSTFEGSAGSSAIAAQSASSLALDGVSITDESVALEVTSYASLAVVDSTIEADRGLTVSYASAFVDGTTISGATNSAISASVAELRVVDSVIRDNEGDVGAGIRAFNSWLAVERSTLTANHTRDHYTQVPGGAISFENQNSTRELGVVDSTISGNTAAHGGGGIGIVVEPGGTADATILRSTVTDNDEGIRAESVTSGFTPCMPYPVLVCFPPPTITSGTTDLAITGSIVAGNTEDVVTDDRIQGDATSNVDPVAVTATYSLIDVDPMLAPLTDNGAATETHHPIDGSPAIDAGDPAFDDAEEVDQRDEPRLVGGRIDIGSVEVQAADAEPAPEPTPEPEPGDGGGGGGGGNEDDEATAIPSGDGDRTGRFETDEGTVELTVLGAGGSEDVTIETGSSESLIDEDDDDGFDLLGTAFDIDVDTDEDTEVCLPYDDEEVDELGMDPHDLELFHFPDGGEPELITTRRSTADDSVCGVADGFSPFALGVLATDRLAGRDGPGTAAAISRSFVQPGVDTVYVASASAWADALGAGPVAASSDSPVLLVRADEVPSATRVELKRLQPRRIVVVGGERVVGDDVVGELGALATVVERIAGVDRYSTAAALSARTFVPGVETAYLVVGTSFADGLVAGPAAALAGGPVLLARGDRLPASTRAELARLRPGRIVVVGGTGAVPESVIDVLGSLTTGAVERWAGIDRYATSATVAAKSGVATVHVATGATASDALAAVPMVAATGGPLVLVGPDTVPASVDAALAALAPTSITVLGGPAAISEDIELRLSRHIER